MNEPRRRIENVEMLRARSWVRRLSLGALLLTILMVGTCSATGLYTARGIGAELIRRDPGSYLSTIVILAGPLLLLQALPLLLTIGTISRGRAVLLLAAISTAAAGSLVTAYAAFVASMARLCVAGAPTQAQDAACAAGTGALAGFFGIAAIAALPFAAALRRNPMKLRSDAVVNRGVAGKPRFQVDAQNLGVVLAVLAALAILVDLASLVLFAVVISGIAPYPGFPTGGLARLRIVGYPLVGVIASLIGLIGGWQMYRRRERGKRLLVLSLGLNIAGALVVVALSESGLATLFSFAGGGPILVWLLIYFLVVISQFKADAA